MQGLFRGLAHHSEDGPPDPGNETAAQLGEAGGGKTNGKAANLQAQEYRAGSPGATEKLPSRAALARKFPKLRINRLTWRWIDDASGASGDDLESLIVFVGGGAR